MPTFTERLAAASRPVRVVPVCLRGDLVAEVQRLEEQLQQARRASVDTLAGRGDARRIAEQIEALREQMLEATEEFRLQGVNARVWQQLVVENPPRPNDAQDRQLGYNAESFFPALVRACVVSPELDDDAWATLLDVLSFGQFDELAGAALAASRYKVDVPFSPAASATLQSSGETSEQLEL